MTKSIVERQPSRMLRFGLRLPIWLYRLNLGWLLGDRFLMLTHTGTKSGLRRQTVIEVVQYDKQSDTFYVVSGWGERSDWYQNVRKSPTVTVHIGARKFRANAKFIPLAEEIKIMETCAHDHPVMFSELSSLFLGERMKPNTDAARRVAEKMPMVAFHPVKSTEI